MVARGEVEDGGMVGGGGWGIKEHTYHYGGTRRKPHYLFYKRSLILL